MCAMLETLEYIRQIYHSNITREVNFQSIYSPYDARDCITGRINIVSTKLNIIKISDKKIERTGMACV
jgi:hypothetical protein